MAKFLFSKKCGIKYFCEIVLVEINDSKATAKPSEIHSDSNQS